MSRAGLFQQGLQFSGFEHFRHDVAATDQLTLDPKLWESRPIGVARQIGPEYQCRFKWEVGSVAFWDNRACQHYGSSDYWPQRRRMERVTVAGDRPYYEDSKTQERQYSYALEERA